MPYIMSISSVPESVSKYINRYFELNIRDQKVRTPYFINKFGILNLPVMAGKGNPDEIEKFVEKYVKDNADENEIRDIMIKKGIGIDCSGLVYNIYNFWISEKFAGKKSLRDFLPKVSIFNIRKYFSRLLKPQNSVSAHEFTSPPFAQRIILSNVKPGDLIRTRGGKHVLFITEVEKNGDFVQKIKFVHSTKEYILNGVRFGEIIFDQNQNLNTAKWVDFPEEDVNFTSQGFRESINSNGFFRPNLPLFEDK